MPRPTHWELVADDPNRAVAFYTSVFDWNFQRWEGPMEYWLFTTGTEGPGINGGLGAREMPGQAPCNVIDVPNIDECIAKVAAAGGAALTPKIAIPGVGWLAYFNDTEGNRFGVMQYDASAA